MFRRLLATSVIAVCAIGLSGCFTSDVLITVRPDGSGIVEQTVTIRPAALLAFDKLASPELAANAQNPDDISRRFQKDYDTWAEAAHLGGNLRPRSVQPIKTGEATGWALTYEFDDVTEMRLQLVPHVPGLSGFYQVASKDPGASTTVSATLKPVNETLERFTFQFPAFAIDPSSEPPTAWASGSAQEMLQLQKLIQGSRVTIAVESTAPIVATNSPFLDQNRVTLFDIDVARALFSKQMSTLASTPATFQELLATLADLPGVTLAHEHEVTIDVRNPSTQISTNAPPSSASPPDTEIYLASLLTNDGSVVVGPPVNITRSPGYDNQPSFTPDGKQILFASVRRGPATARDNAKAPGAASPATDIYRYDIDA
ncbi:MAG: PD40 domain-containing protein, partial [Acidobacteria bacterium]|nr:PD40 domain-containing protein [Acidobacteriota bacterium]